MPTYVSLVTWTELGRREATETVRRARFSAMSDAEAFNGRIQDVFWMSGPYDIVAILSFPDDESAAAFSLYRGTLGKVRMLTFRVYSADEMSAIVQRAVQGPSVAGEGG